MAADHRCRSSLRAVPAQDRPRTAGHPAGAPIRLNPRRSSHTQEGSAVMFTDAELDYLASQRLGRLATAQPDGTLQASPVGFRYNSRTGTIDIGGLRMAASRKFRNVADN